MSKVNKIMKFVGNVFIIAIVYYLATRLLYYFYSTSKIGFANYSLENAGIYPRADTVPILSGDYKYSGHKNVSNDSYNEIWWHYPMFKEGSYKQITNNLRYWKNPDEGTCVRAEFCGALYKDQENKSNIVLPLPEAEVTPGPRVNYYRTDVDVFPHTTNDFPGLY